MADQDVLLVERRGETDWVTLNRPERLNALNQPLSDALLAYSKRGGATPRRA